MAPAALLIIRRPGGGPVTGLLAWYGCHPSIMGPDNRLFTADFPGVVRDRLSAAYAGAPVIYLGGPAGDISTRHTRQAQSWAEVERLGNQLADQLLSLAPDLAPVPSGHVAGLIGSAPLGLAGLPASAPLRYRERQGRLSKVGARCPVQVVRLGGLALVGVGAELFLEPGIQLANGSPFPLTLVTAPANGSIGNLPSRLFDQESTSAVLHAANRLLHQLYHAKG